MGEGPVGTAPSSSTAPLVELDPLPPLLPDPLVPLLPPLLPPALPPPLPLPLVLPPPSAAPWFMELLLEDPQARISATGTTRESPRAGKRFENDVDRRWTIGMRKATCNCRACNLRLREPLERDCRHLRYAVFVAIDRACFESSHGCTAYVEPGAEPAW